MGRSYGMPEMDDEELEAELTMLNDEIALEEDTSYLEDVTAPKVISLYDYDVTIIENKIYFLALKFNNLPK